MDAPLVILGTGLAGYALLRALRHLDRSTPVCLIGADDAAAYSKSQLPAGLARGRSADDLVIATAEQMAYRFDATIAPRSRVVAIDPERRVVVLRDAQERAFSRLVIATGAEAHRPTTVRGSGASSILTVGSLSEYAYLRSELAGRRRVAVLGGGIVACELAESLKKGGCEVTLLEPGDRLLGRIAPALAAERIADALGAAGVRVRVEDGIQRIDQGLDELELTTLGGSRLAVDVIVAALGTQPRVQLAQAAGLDVGRGISVDSGLRTSAEGIYALGACAELDGRLFTLADDIEHSAEVLAGVLNGKGGHFRWKPRAQRLSLDCCAVALCEPPPVAGEWQESATARGVRALFHDRMGALRGFMLVGDLVGETGRLIGRVAR